MTNSSLPPVPLDPVCVPLFDTHLIEASAGTGKTYTIGSLYLRLLLQAGKNCFERPLNIEQILVVTFTDMATEELRKKIRQRINTAKEQYENYLVNQDKSLLDPLLRELLPTIYDLPQAIHRLKMAEQNMDLAAIYTIHSFCQRMLMQYAFNSGTHFNLALEPNENDLLLQFAREFWRKEFYPQPLLLTNLIAQHLQSPNKVIEMIKNAVGRNLAVSVAESEQDFLNMPLAQYFQQYFADNSAKIEQYQAQQQEIKQLWLACQDKIIQLVTEAVKNKQLNGNSYRLNSLTSYFNEIHLWAIDEQNFTPPRLLKEKFSQQTLINKTNKGQQPICHFVFELIDKLRELPPDSFKQIVLYHYVQGINHMMMEYKQNHQRKGFDDLLRLLQQALYQPNGEHLAELIRSQYPFAMIDEFQDTDQIQYKIFSKVYVNQPNVGFIMIGDPKQAIYKFRGADIFSYFNAAKQAKNRFNLNINYRSHQSVVDLVNALFQVTKPPFLQPEIQFNPVNALNYHPHFCLDNQVQPAIQVYLTDQKQEMMAETCAKSIAQWLQGMVENKAFIADNTEQKPLKAQNIAVLVENGNQAQMVKKSLQKLGIATVYLSDRQNVFESQECKDLICILSACLTPTARNILNAIACSVFSLTAAQIHQINHNHSSGERDLNQWFEVFNHCQKLWRIQGILPMLHYLLLTEKISERLLQSVNGERRITDLLHLAELLQQASTEHIGEAALLHWLEKQQDNAENNKESENKAYQIRLESERELVQIVTIHKSKGLEYDLVWLPFLGYQNPKGFQQDNIPVYYSPEQQKIYWDMDNSHQTEVNYEKFAEKLRLLYVALTRAKYAMAICLPKQFNDQWNALLYLLSQQDIGLLNKPSSSTDKNKTSYQTEILLQQFKQNHPQLSLQYQCAELLLKQKFSKINVINEQKLEACQFTGKIEQNWQLTSFTALEQSQRNPYSPQSINQQNFDQGYDYDATDDLMPVIEQTDVFNPFSFPRGAKIGTQLHRYFEKTPISDWYKGEIIQQFCNSLGLEQEWIAPIQQWFKQICHTPLLPNNTFCLGQLLPQDCLKELQFYLNIKGNFNPMKFNQALAKYHHLTSDPLQVATIKGMVRGVIDLLFRHQGKYYLVDYKSNYLGDKLEYYQGKKLNYIMETKHYDWQYLLYCLAVHRYLTQRDKNYCYEQHFGGVIYAFLRGMQGQTGQGIFFDKPDWALIQQLEEIF